jgi:hypothetical protein
MFEMGKDDFLAVHEKKRVKRSTKRRDRKEGWMRESAERKKVR